MDVEGTALKTSANVSCRNEESDVAKDELVKASDERWKDSKDFRMGKAIGISMKYIECITSRDKLEEI